MNMTTYIMFVSHCLKCTYKLLRNNFSLLLLYLDSKILGTFDVDKSPTWCQETVGRMAENAPLLAAELL